MKKLWLVVIVCIVGLNTANAQDAKAGAILDAMSNNYKNMKTFKADFNYAAVSSSGKMASTRTGSIAVKGTKFKLNMVGQEIYNNGAEIYSYVKETNEVNITEYDASENSQFSPANIYSIYKKGYKYVFKGEKNVGGEPCEVVELTPTGSDANLKKLEITVAKKSKNIKNWKLWDKSGKQTVFNILKFTPNVALADSYFKFNAANYPGVEVVDLR